MFRVFLCIYLSKKRISYKEFRNKSLILILIGITIFYARNIKRLNKEYVNYSYNPFENTKYKFTESEEFYFRYNSKIKNNYNKYDKKVFLGKKIIIIKQE